MSARITADEAKALLTGITPGRWTTCLRADLCVVVDDGTEEGGDGDPVAEILITDERPSRNQMADALLLAAAPDLAETVVQLSADLHRVTMELHAARHLAEEGQRARVKQSMELAKAQSRLSRMESALRDAVRRCQVDDCDRIATVRGLYGVVRIYACDACCDDVALTSQEPLPHADVLRSLDAPAGGDS